MGFWDKKEVKKLFQKLTFSNVPIEKPRIEHPKNIDLLHELPFYDELMIKQISKAFKRYTRSNKTKIINSKYSLVQLEASKSSIKDLFKDLLNEIKGFRYQITVKVLLSRYKKNGDIEFTPVYFNSATKIVINFEYMFSKSFQKISYRIGNWINEGSGWIIKSIEAEYVNIYIYSPLSGSSCTKLLVKLRKSVKGLIDIKNNENKCFLWCHIRHLNPLKIHPGRIAKANKNMVNDLDYEGIKCSVSKGDYRKFEQKNNVCINIFCYENELTYPVNESNKKFKGPMDFDFNRWK